MWQICYRFTGNGSYNGKYVLHPLRLQELLGTQGLPNDFCVRETYDAIFPHDSFNRDHSL